MTKRILITGATGRVGSSIARQMPASCDVRVGVRNIERAQTAFDKPLTYVLFDFEDPTTYADALDGVTDMFLMLPPVGTQPVFDVIDAAVERGVSHVVLLSILRADKLRVVPHRRIEEYLEQAPLTYTFLRAGYFMQNLSSVHKADIAEHHEIYIPAGKGKFLFVDVRDVAAVGVQALTESGHENTAYELTGREARTFGEVAQVFSDVLERRIDYHSPNPIAFVRRMMRDYDHALSFALFMLVEYTVTRIGLLGEEPSPELEHLLGRPPTTIAQFVDDYRAVWA